MVEPGRRVLSGPIALLVILSWMLALAPVVSTAQPNASNGVNDQITYSGIMGVVASITRETSLMFEGTADGEGPSWTSEQVQEAITFYWQETMGTIPTTTKKTSWYTEGGAREPGSTIKVYAPDNTDASLKSSTTASTTVNATTNLYDFTLSFTLSEGINQVYIEEVDVSNNSSGRVLYDTFTVDKTAPTITLSGPATGTSTTAAQITVSGTITDTLVAYDQLVVTIDCTGSMVAKTVYLSADGSFTTTVPLVEGTNVINVIARDAMVITALTGNQKISSVTVTRTAQPSTALTIPASTGGTAIIHIAETNVTINILVVPPNALSENTTVTVVETPVEAPTGYAVVGKTFEFGPSGTTFATPSTLTLPYNENEIPAGVSEDDLAIYRRDAPGDSWERLGGVVNKSANTVSVEIDHLSEYAVMAQLQTAPPAPMPAFWVLIITALALVAVLIAVIWKRLST